jgi:hypothetical protein
LRGTDIQVDFSPFRWHERSLPAKSESAEQLDRPVILGLRDRVQLQDSPAGPRLRYHAMRRFGGVAETDVLREQRKAEVRVLEEVAFDQPAQAEGRALRCTRYRP